MLEISPYLPEDKIHFDRFVLNESVNGTFLQTRNFLEYHPKDRFEDASLCCHNGGPLYALIPGAKVGADFVSHPGSTFGGPIFSPYFYTGNRIFQVLKAFDSYFSKNYRSVKLKITPPLFAKESPALLEYALEQLGYTRHTELSSYTPLEGVNDPLELCDGECRRIIRKIKDYPIEYREFNKPEDYTTFYEYLVLAKKKYGVTPVHTLEELLDLKKRIKENIRFRGIWCEGVFVSAIMSFVFKETQNIHGQYIATNPKFKKFQPGTAIYYYTMIEGVQEGFKNVSWGISTEKQGTYLNQNLIHFKESFGAKHTQNPFYIKNF